MLYESSSFKFHQTLHMSLLIKFNMKHLLLLHLHTSKITFNFCYNFEPNKSKHVFIVQSFGSYLGGSGMNMNTLELVFMTCQHMDSIDAWLLHLDVCIVA